MLVRHIDLSEKDVQVKLAPIDDYKGDEKYYSVLAIVIRGGGVPVYKVHPARYKELTYYPWSTETEMPPLYLPSEELDLTI